MSEEQGAKLNPSRKPVRPVRRRVSAPQSEAFVVAMKLL